MLETVYHTDQHTRWLELLEQDDQADPPQAKDVPQEHAHLLLHDLLAAALADANLAAMPREVGDLCRAMAAEEANAPERYRYHRVRLKRKGPLVDAFPETTTLPLVAMQESLEDVFERIFHFDPYKDDKQETWGGDLAYQAYLAERVVYDNYPSTIL
jgi:hypothetical protein